MKPGDDTRRMFHGRPATRPTQPLTRKRLGYIALFSILADVLRAFPQTTNLGAALAIGVLATLVVLGIWSVVKRWRFYYGKGRR